jgi:phospholipid/cholesterol/gamma-HCH transport system substrate-binding protein/paraquat-inducible protein B
MKSKAHYFRIGLFALFMLALLIVGLVLINADVFKGDRILIETYLDESVQGLSVGTSLLNRGVAIGRIEKITFVTQEYREQLKPNSPEFDKFNRYVMLIMSVERKHFSYISDNLVEIESEIRNQINNGLRLKLSYQGITGIALIEADYMDPVRNPPLAIAWKPRSIYIPSAKSLITNFTQAVDTVFQRLEKVDFPALFTQMETTMKSIQTGVDEAKLGEVRQSAMDMMDQLNKTLQRANSLLQTSDPNSPPVSLADTISQLDRNLKQIEDIVSTHQDDIDTILTDLKSLTRSLKQLSEQIKADPAQLFFSTPPSQSEIVK